jgi:hypothetical protein
MSHTTAIIIAAWILSQALIILFFMGAGGKRLFKRKGDA